MFKIVHNPTFKHLVEVSVPVDGGFAKQSFTGHFRVLSDNELESHKTDSLANIKDYVRAFFIGWDDIVDDEKNHLPYSESLRERLIGVPYVRRALIDTYTAAMVGAKRGN